MRWSNSCVRGSAVPPGDGRWQIRTPCRPRPGSPTARCGRWSRRSCTTKNAPNKDYWLATGGDPVAILSAATGGRFGLQQSVARDILGPDGFGDELRAAASEMRSRGGGDLPAAPRDGCQPGGRAQGWTAYLAPRPSARQGGPGPQSDLDPDPALARVSAVHSLFDLDARGRELPSRLRPVAPVTRENSH